MCRLRASLRRKCPRSRTARQLVRRLTHWAKPRLDTCRCSRPPSARTWGGLFASLLSVIPWTGGEAPSVYLDTKVPLDALIAVSRMTKPNHLLDHFSNPAFRDQRSPVATTSNPDRLCLGFGWGEGNWRTVADFISGPSRWPVAWFPDANVAFIPETEVVRKPAHRWPGDEARPLSAPSYGVRWRSGSTIRIASRTAPVTSRPLWTAVHG